MKVNEKIRFELGFIPRMDRTLFNIDFYHFVYLTKFRNFVNKELLRIIKESIEFRLEKLRNKINPHISNSNLKEILNFLPATTIRLSIICIMRLNKNELASQIHGFIREFKLNIGVKIKTNLIMDYYNLFAQHDSVITRINSSLIPIKNSLLSTILIQRQYMPVLFNFKVSSYYIPSSKVFLTIKQEPFKSLNIIADKVKYDTAGY